MTCGCKATIGEKDPRAEIWVYILGKREFPLRHPMRVNMGDVVGLGYEGDAKALTDGERERLVEKMTEKFHITREQIEETLKEGVVPIKAEGVIVEICRMHFMHAVIMNESGDEEEEERERYERERWEDGEGDEDEEAEWGDDLF